MERQIAETAAVCDMVRGHKRSPKKLWLSFDEWNVWYRATQRRLPSTATDKKRRICWRKSTTWKTRCWSADLINSLLRNADRVKIACLAQLVNVIAPIMTNANGLLRADDLLPV